MGQGLEEQQQGLACHDNSQASHRATSIDKENVFFGVLADSLFLVTFFTFIQFWLVHDIRISIYFLRVDYHLLSDFESLLRGHEVRHDGNGNRLVAIWPISNKANWLVNVVVSKKQHEILMRD